MRRTGLACFALVILIGISGIAAEPSPGAVEYADKVNLLFFQDASGKRVPVRSPADWSIRVGHLRATMEQVMGALPAPTSEPLAVEVKSETPLRHYLRRHLTFVVEKDDRLPAYLLIPHHRPGPLPAMICLPGSSAPGKDNPAGLTPQAPMAYAHELAERGYVCLVLDYPLLHTKEYATDPYARGYASTTMKGIVNHRRGVDLLESLPFVNRKAIGVIGHSLGGHNALFLAVFDPRVQAVVSSCGFNTFAKHNRGNVTAWSTRHYMPRIKTVHGDDPKKIPFDFTEVLAALAPRPVFVNAPLHDAPDFEVSGVRDCVASALPVYQQVFDAADRLVVQYPDAGHTFPTPVRLAAYAFLDQHFRPANGEVDLKKGLVGHWPFEGHSRDLSGQGNDAVNHGADLTAPGPTGQPGKAAQFDGRAAHLEVPMKPSLSLGQNDFSLAVWIWTEPDWDDVPGDLVSQYDPARRRGFHLSLKTNAGVTFSQANACHLQFGIDNDRDSAWTDHGQPGKALLAFALAAYEGQLYAGTCEPGKGETGRVYRYVGPDRWIDCGSPAPCNAVTALAVHDGRLYAGVGKYRVAGSALPESENPHLGGKVFRYDGGTKWTDCGQLPGVEAVGGLVVYRGRLYASSLYRPAGFFRYESGTTWTDCGSPDAKRVEALAVYNGYLYGSSYDGGRVYRYNGKQWTDCGQLGDNTQTYSFAVHEGRLYVGTWPSGRVYRFEEVGRWTDVGRLGQEKEVMGMVVHNGRLLAGTLPLAEVHQYDGNDRWKKLTRLDPTPNVTYRRAWTAAEFQGQTFFSTLPSGKVFAFEAGKSATWEHSFPAGWQHVAAIKRGGRLELYLNGVQIAGSAAFDISNYDLTSDRPLQIGAGTNDKFRGRLSDLRLYQRALNTAEVRSLATRP